MPSTDENVMLGLSKNEAIVLFEFVSRYSQDRKLNIEDQAEQRVLCDICCMLERKLVEPLAANYSDILSHARDQVRDENRG